MKIALYLLLIITVGCSSVRNDRMEIGLTTEDCGGFTLKKIGKSDSIEVVLNVYDCHFSPRWINSSHLTYAEYKKSERKMNLTAKNQVFGINEKVYSVYYKFSVFAINFGTVTTSHMRLETKTKYTLTFHLPTSDPLLN